MTSGAARQRAEQEAWRLVERYVDYADPGFDWRCVFKREDTTLNVGVPEDVWRAFDGISLSPASPNTEGDCPHCGKPWGPEHHDYVSAIGYEGCRPLLPDKEKE